MTRNDFWSFSADTHTHKRWTFDHTKMHKHTHTPLDTGTLMYGYIQRMTFVVFSYKNI